VAVGGFIGETRPGSIIVAAAKVGGIHANNTYPAEFIYDNLMIEANLIHGAYKAGCERLLFLGSSCIYPKLAEQPMKEEALLTDVLEPTNEPYAIAKITGIKLCESYNRQYGTDFRSLMPTNLYGLGDNFHAEDSHVIPALMRRVHEAKLAGEEEVVIWGTGSAMREFLHVDDLAQASTHILGLPKSEIDAATSPMCSHINVGTGVDVTIRELAETLVRVIGFDGKLVFDKTKPDGTPRKLLDVSKINSLGWRAEILLEEGLASTYEWFLDHQESLRT
ncbi:MAG: GDP-L-fucose synthase, partial [Gammaproteobacteria bacterium]|nr:GDP-L-fucose synthase [Gammaproteobacteria bacterium]